LNTNDSNAKAAARHLDDRWTSALGRQRSRHAMRLANMSQSI
jgi:hypothetical protein